MKLQGGAGVRQMPGPVSHGSVRCHRWISVKVRPLPLKVCNRTLKQIAGMLRAVRAGWKSGQSETDGWQARRKVETSAP